MAVNLLKVIETSEPRNLWFISLRTSVTFILTKTKVNGVTKVTIFMVVVFIIGILLVNMKVKR